MMGTALVAGRVDEDVKARADAYIAKAGLTQAAVIRSVWQTIAETGRIPTIDDGASSSSELKSRMRTLREETPRSEYLENLTPAELKKELEHRA